MKVAVVGATGMVGRVMIQLLEERNFPVTELIPVASENSVGKEISFKNTTFKVVSLETALNLNPQIALFSAGGQTSLDWAEKFAAIGCTVIDNSSAWRMDESKKLIVPEINASELEKKDKIIANPNCSTIQLVMVLHSLHQKYKINRLVVSTYQSITGTGVKAVKQLEDEYQNIAGEKAYPYQIHQNAIPHCDSFTQNGYTKEEMKLTNETKKILNDNSVKVTATAVRIPVVGGHSESVNIEFLNDFTLEDIREILTKTPGLQLQDSIENNLYPMPFYSKNKDAVFVGRIRRDFSQQNTLNLWIVADNLRKGAATNAVQIAEYLVQNHLMD